MTLLCARCLKLTFYFLGLGELIDDLYKQKPEWKCVLDTPEKPPVDIDLQWVGRPKELALLKTWAKENIGSHLHQRKTKQMYRYPLVHGGLGDGMLCWFAVYKKLKLFL